jgi:hypothetical protein
MTSYSPPCKALRFAGVWLEDSVDSVIGTPTPRPALRMQPTLPQKPEAINVDLQRPRSGVFPSWSTKEVVEWCASEWRRAKNRLAFGRRGRSPKSFILYKRPDGTVE